MFELTAQQKANFDRDGFLVVERLIDEDTVEILRETFERLFKGEFETGVSPDEVNWQQSTGDPSLTRQICNGWKANIAIAKVVTRPDIGQAIAMLGEWPGTRVMSDNVLWKPPQTRSLGYHQDNSFLSWFRPSELLSCWIALDEQPRMAAPLNLSAVLIDGVTPGLKESSTARNTTDAIWRLRLNKKASSPKLFTWKCQKAAARFTMVGPGTVPDSTILLIPGAHW